MVSLYIPPMMTTLMDGMIILSTLPVWTFACCYRAMLHETKGY